MFRELLFQGYSQISLMFGLGPIEQLDSVVKTGLKQESLRNCTNFFA